MRFASRGVVRIRGLVKAGALIIGLCLSLPSLAVADPIGDYSGTCTAASAVGDGYVGTTYVRLRTQPAPADPQTTWVCFRVSNPAAGDVGGRFDITSASTSGPLPGVDGDAGACQANAGSNTAPGTHPAVAGSVLSQPISVDDYAASGAAWICVQVGSLSKRVVIAVPGATVPSVASHLDTAAPTPPAAVSDPFPSGRCEAGTAGEVIHQLANFQASGVHAWMYWSGRSWGSDTNICARIEGPVQAGGILTVDDNVGIRPTVTTSADLTPCTLSIFELVQPQSVSIRTSAAGVLPASLCVAAGSQGQRVTVDPSANPTPPTVTWTPDP